MLGAIAECFTANEARYGSPMRTAGLRAKAGQGYRGKAAVHHLYARHPNRLWSTHVDRPTQVWVGGITDLEVGNSWRYLAIVMDRYSRRILAWPLTRRRTACFSTATMDPSTWVLRSVVVCCA